MAHCYTLCSYCNLQARGSLLRAPTVFLLSPTQHLLFQLVMCQFKIRRIPEGKASFGLKTTCLADCKSPHSYELRLHGATNGTPVWSAPVLGRSNPMRRIGLAFVSIVSACKHCCGRGRTALQTIRESWAGSHRAKRGCSRLLFGLLASLCLSVSLHPAAKALTLDELRSSPELTPERFSKYFADFTFALGRETRDPQTFLANRCGDCDDFATLAASVLREKGYTTRLVVVYMTNAAHVVCYVAETKGYLDFNRRQSPNSLVSCEADLASIGTSVAESFHMNWRSASEFSVNNGVRKFILTTFR